MKWITSLWRVLAIVALLAAAAGSRTVLPITYAYGTVSDGDSESTIQYGAHTTGPGQDAGAARHPSRLAHHYYEPPQPPATEEAPSGADTAPTSPGRRSRKKNEYVARVSYVRKAPDVTTTAASRGESAQISTESIMSPVRVRKKGRWLRLRNEIPVNEELTGEVPVVASGSRPTESNTERNMERVNRIRVNQTLQSAGFESGLSLPANGFRQIQNSSTTRFRPKPKEPKNMNRSAPAGSIRTNQSHQKWSYTRLTSTTEDPDQQARNNSLVRAEHVASSHPVQVLHYTTEASGAEEEFDFVTKMPPMQSIRNVTDRNTDQLSFANASYQRKTNTSIKTTPVPKYKEAYFRRPFNAGGSRINSPAATAFPGTQQWQGASTHRFEKERIYERPAVLTTEQPAHEYAEPQQQLPPDPADESAEEPGTHRESLTYSDTEKTEKTEEILRDLEYPEQEEAEDEEESEVEEEVREPDVEDSPAKVLQKPIRYAYSADQNISESQTRDQPQKGGGAGAKGGGEKHVSAHHKSEGDKGERDYESALEYDKGKKGHLDKENRNQHQEEEQGKKKKLLEEGGHQELHHVSSKGEKGTLFGESGSHKKGHSTKGSHNIHKKNEFLKKHEFYDEHHEDDEHKKYGDYHKGHKFVKDHMYNKKHKDGNFSEGHKGKMGKNHNGHRFRQHKGHDDAFKHVDHYAHSEDYGEGGHHSEGKKWKYEML